jgi:malate dehydrogenase
VRVLVVGNPCNTNCLIAMNNAKDVPAESLVRHDPARRKPRQKPARRQSRSPLLRSHQPRPSGATTATQYPDFYNAKIGGNPATEVISDHDWLKGDFISTVQQRGAAIIKARGLISAASAANAACDTVRSLSTSTPAGDWTSVASCSDGSYGIEKGLMFSFPIRSTGSAWEIVQDLPTTSSAKAKSTPPKTNSKKNAPPYKNSV